MLTDDQLKKRRNYIGGSEVAAILGISPYMTPLDVYNKKIGQEDEFKGNKDTVAGSIMEPAILNLYASEASVHLKKLSDEQLEFTHPEYPYMKGHADGIDQKGGIIEVKNVGAHASKRWGDTDGLNVPDGYLVQLIYYCVITDAPYGKLVAYFGGSDLRVYDYKREPSIEKNIIESVKRFWEEHIIKKVSPPPTTLKEMVSYWPTIEGKIKVAQDDLLENIYALKSLRDQQKILKAEEEKLLTDIWRAMEGSDMIVDALNTPLAVTKSIEVQRINMARLREENEEIYRSYLKSSTQKTLRIKI